MARTAAETSRWLRPRWRHGAAGPHARRCLILVCGVLLVGLAAPGCKGLWEDTKEYWTDRTHPPDPWQVVTAKDTNPDRKARFVAQLREPLQNGGTQAQQDEMVTLLSKMALNDPMPVLRLAAIDRLGKLKDPRRVQAIEAALYNANFNRAEEINSQIRQQALRSLGETRDPAAAAELIRVARASAKENNSFEEKLTLDERLTAIRALADFHGGEVNVALLQILRTEKDVALRERAARSLESSSGRRVPSDKAHDDPQAWEQVLNTGADAAPQSKLGGGPLQLIKGWQKKDAN